MADADLYDYDLPRELIAQQPLADRSAARLLVVRRGDGRSSTGRSATCPNCSLRATSWCVNDTRVVPARLVGRRAATGGKWEGLFLQVEPARESRPARWRLLAQTRGRPAVGERIVLVDRDGPRRGRGSTLVGRAAGGGVAGASRRADEPAEAVLVRVGRVPLPGYIRGGADEPGDVERYQTVFARDERLGRGSRPPGSTSRHDLLAALACPRHRPGERHAPCGPRHLPADHGRAARRPPDAHRVVRLPGRRRPPPSGQTRARGGRVVAIGTTAVRTLETAARAAEPEDTIAAWSGPTDLFIRPGHRFPSGGLPADQLPHAADDADGARQHVSPAAT